MRVLFILFFVFVSSAALAEGCGAVAYERRIPGIEKLGKAMHRQDMAAAGATDILFSQHPDLKAHPVAGWVVTGEAVDLLVTFIGKRGEEYAGRFDVRPEAREATASGWREAED